MRLLAVALSLLAACTGGQPTEHADEPAEPTEPAGIQRRRLATGDGSGDPKGEPELRHMQYNVCGGFSEDHVDNDPEKDTYKKGAPCRIGETPKKGVPL